MSLIHGGVRFVPTRAGIVNLWDYRDQEFCFADGRLVLRGPNGSGKTKGLEVLFPFVFDGRIEPRRLNPFAGEERTMKSNLLYRKQDSAYSYVWMEFARGDWDDPEVVTVGIGMRATKSSDKVTRWYFVADGRVGVDFSLIGADDRPLTRKQLAEQIGTDAILDRPLEYRAAIDARMFGLGLQRYDQLINLILTLRRPQLAKNLDPRGLSQALTDGLRPLDDQLILDAARSFSDMEEVGRTLEGLVQADTATRAFVGVYRKYLAVQAKSDVDQVQARQEAVTHASTALFAATVLRERRDTERTTAETRAEEADRGYEQALADRETLQRSGAYEGKQQLDDLADAVRRLETSAAVHRDKATKAGQVVDQRAGEADHARAAEEAAVAALTRGEDELRTAAEEAGLDWSTLPETARAEQLTVTVRSHAEERDADVRAVRQALTLVDTAEADRARAERAAQRATDQRDTATAALAEAEAGVTLARTNTAAALRDWWKTHREVFGHSDLLPASDATQTDLLPALEAAQFEGHDGPAPAEILAERTESLTDAIRGRREQFRTAAAQAAARLTGLRTEQQQVAAEKDDAPSPFATRGTRTGRPGAPLWQLVRFADHVTADQAAGIEAALQAANLLDAWLCADTPLPAHDSDQFLLPLPAHLRPVGRTLADVLVAEDGMSAAHDVATTDPVAYETDSPIPAVPREFVAAVLSSIALHDEIPSAASGPIATASTSTPAEATSVAGLLDDPDAGRGVDRVAVALDGSYQQGVQVGRHAKAHAEFIGATARARRRALRLAELEAAIGNAAEEERAARDAERRETAELTRISAAAKALPRSTAVLAAQRAVAEAAGVLRSRTETAAQAERDLDQAVAERTAADKKVRAVAVAHRAPRDPAELDALAAAIRHFEHTGTALLRLRGDQQREGERRREAEDRLAESRDLAEAFAEEAEAARSGYQEQSRKLETLREALGAGAADIDRELTLARERIDAARAEQKSARKAAAEAIEGVGTAEGAYRAAHDALRAALTELLADVRALAPYARPDLLSLLGAAPARWPAADGAWSTPEQLLYRIETGGPDAEPRVLPEEVQQLFDGLCAATASVRAGEAVRKSTRSTVTAALQEFDAALATAGQDYRLHWDAADGLTVVQVHDEQGVAALADFADRIAAARADQELLLTDAERRILEDALLSGLAQQIHERTGDARELITRMGAEMKQRRMSSGNTIGVHWVLADTLSESARAVCKMLDRDASELSPGDLATVRAHFAAEIRTARAAHPERSYPEILATTLDYRTWRVFAFTLVTADGAEDRLTVARHSALSGGEQSVSLHLPLFAAAHVMLDSADPQAPRLLALDEAFAGVDDNGRSELLGLSVDFDLDLFMTGYDLWITYDHVPACAHYDLAHSAAENTVSATLLVWDSRDLLAEHDGSDLTTALGSPGRRRVAHTVEGGITFDEALELAP
ncbi:SbcC/MukB-like Walker B domain-containing protein [Nocardia sp. alder85J]|uniref:SbcC/MukB-like Walker B domain-containing protein n=1 Tax=Nocardia sp. alder85J TaxID=2862949 RepID=UPI001CD23C30|nr:SbcC/MukB-like Walker B domain-containing protein [Nocardia sp. alder85J]MCX4092739.1 endonuclease [Nocardia sp. alder85J]